MFQLYNCNKQTNSPVWLTWNEHVEIYKRRKNANFLRYMAIRVTNDVVYGGANEYKICSVAKIWTAHFGHTLNQQQYWSRAQLLHIIPQAQHTNTDSYTQVNCVIRGDSIWLWFVQWNCWTYIYIFAILWATSVFWCSSEPVPRFILCVYVQFVSLVFDLHF